MSPQPSIASNLRILFNLNTAVHLRYFDETIAQLLARDHEVLLTFTRPGLYGEALEILADFDPAPENLGQAPKRSDEYSLAARDIRSALDYLRYLDPRYAHTEALRHRVWLKAQRGSLSRAFARLERLRPWQVRLAMRCLLAAEEAIPSSRRIEAFLRSVAPDVVLVSPLTNAASPQTDHVKSAMALGIPTGVCIPSWDNLTNKGHIKIVPHRVVVWNDQQVREAVDLHGIPPERVEVTGAQPFDRWFGRRPSTSREEFCTKVGLPPDRPYVLFCGSRANIREGEEPRFVRQWIDAMRSDGRALQELGILVRPHPERQLGWENETLDSQPDAVIWPEHVDNSIAAQSRADYFDSLYHAAAVVGINTSAMIEAAIIGRPVLTIRAREFTESHDGTLHFQYLRREHGGFLQEAPSLAEHLGQLERAIADPQTAQQANAGFVQRFIRPHGPERPCTPILVEAIERLAQETVLPSVPSSLHPGYALLRRAARTLADREAPSRPAAARERAKRAALPLHQLARRARPHSRAVARTAHWLAARVEARGRSRSEAIKERRRLSHAIGASAKRLDPEDA